VVPWLQPMRVMRRLVLPAALLFAACGPPGEVPVGDAGPDPVDAPEGMAGLEFRWSASGLGENGDATIDRVRFFLRDLRASGDATSGDETYQPVHMLEFRADGSGPVPMAVDFRSAPPGRYSAFEFRLARPMDGEAAWDMEGDCMVDDQTYDLEVEDDQESSVSLPLDLVLAPGETVVIDIDVAIDLVVEGIDWSQGQIDDDTLVVDEDSPLMAGIRARLMASFTVAGIN
jgi:hypothetical protein